ncbi:hypothetical protein GP486_005503 [Trichoglossum hirsutum]|uniref:Fucose-specific lectin n=1 Tax=Trichoglossum hirsutum TaxID=265104 RepID=A0A9P8L917_9PEZI|nr:hypothetical protein GP486_005503 [Trichoglossum hirsutum]
MDFTNFSAIEFNIGNKRHLRLYYQTKDKVIRESSFEAGIGWFIRGDGVVAKNAKENSPITATRWISNNTVHCPGTYTSSGTTWQPASPLRINKVISVSADSYLAIACPGQDDKTLRLFYQEESAGNPIREVKFKKGTTTWTLQSTKISDAIAKTSFSIVSAGKTGNVRIYFEDTNHMLRVSLWSAEGGQWLPSKTIEDHELVPNAPISAVCWYAGQTTDIEELRIRVYTILKSQPTVRGINELARNGEDWDDPRCIGVVLSGDPHKSALTACRDKSTDSSDPISIFYQPHPKIIDVILPGAHHDIVCETKPKGIPISFGSHSSAGDASTAGNTGGSTGGRATTGPSGAAAVSEADIQQLNSIVNDLRGALPP